MNRACFIASKEVFMRHLPLLFLLPLFILSACQERRDAALPETARAATVSEAPELLPPTAPMLETFDGEPQLSLFPRVGAFRPEDDDEEGGPFWLTYIDHLLRTSGAVNGAGRSGDRAWALRSLSGIDSVAFFSPLAVQPRTTYQVRFAFSGELPPGGTAGIGVLEFDEFLWVGEQYTKTLQQKHQTGAHPGISLQGRQEWAEHRFEFTTSEGGRMVHLILFRDGEADRQHPVYFDDIVIEALPAAAAGS
jgi:hypothetical protein